MKKHNIVYQITNLINGKIYIGVHTTNKIKDNYMGSSKKMKNDIKKYGKNNFKKEILFNFDSKEEMFDIEEKIVNEEFIQRKDTYNQHTGGKGGWEHNIGWVCVKDKNGCKYRIRNDDPRYLSGVLVHHLKGTVTVKDKNGNTMRVSTNDPRYINGELVHNLKGTITSKDKEGNISQVSKDDPRYLSGELVSVIKGTVRVKDENGACISVSTDDPRYLSGELVFVNTNRKQTEKTKKAIGIKNRKNNLGMIWILNKETNEKKRIKKEKLQEWIYKGWIKGRKIKKKT